MKMEGWSGPACARPTPSPQDCDQQRHELPLRAAGVLELVHEHVVVARLEAVPALRELLHLPQQVERAQQHVGEVEHGVGVERPPVLGLGDAEHPPDSARHEHVEIALVAQERLLHSWRVIDDEVAVRAPVRLGRELGLRVHQPGPRLAFLRQEVLAQPCERGLHGGRVDRGARFDGAADLSQRSGEEEERRLGRAGLQEPIEAAPHPVRTRPRTAAVAARLAAAVSRSRGASRQVVGQHARRHDAAVQQRREAGARAPLAELREHERHILVVAREAAADAKSAVERLVHQPRHLGLICHREAGIEIGLERELAQQRQAERVDRADGDVGRAVAQVAPSRAAGISPRAAAARSVDTMRSRISAAALRVNVIARMLDGSTPARSRLT